MPNRLMSLEQVKALLDELYKIYYPEEYKFNKNGLWFWNW
jgi:hypothetical protein